MVQRFRILLKPACTVMSKKHCVNWVTPELSYTIYILPTSLNLSKNKCQIANSFPKKSPKGAVIDLIKIKIKTSLYNNYIIEKKTPFSISDTFFEPHAVKNIYIYIAMFKNAVH